MIKEINMSLAKQFVETEDLLFWQQQPAIAENSPIDFHFLGFYYDEKLEITLSYYTLIRKKCLKFAYITATEVVQSLTHYQQYIKELKAYFKKKGYIGIYLIPTLQKCEWTKQLQCVDSNKQIEAIYQQEQAYVVTGQTFPTVAYVKKLTDETEDSLEKQLHKNAKRLLKKAKKEQLFICDIKLSELEEVYPLFEESATKNGFIPHSLEKLKHLMRVLSDKVSIKAVCLQKEEHIKRLREQLQQPDLQENKKQCIHQRLERLLACSKERVVIGAALFYQSKKGLLYDSGGSFSEFNQYGTMYFLMFEQIKYAKQQQLDYYNFGGIHTKIVTPKHIQKDCLYDFKHKFEGNLIEFYPEMIIPTKPLSFLIANKLWHITHAE